MQNKLAQASSPYLLQHANNPVEWYEWSEEALRRSREQNKPLLISIGYSACHWCHVMAHESFEDTSIAAYMNANFINIKIDREERPDIDQIYMDAAQLITGRGGWPLNAFALPDGRPFYAGTYFTKDNWMRLLQQITELYQSDYSDIVKQAEAVSSGIQKHTFKLDISGNQEFLSQEDYEELFARMQINVDFERGGFKRAPKFPLPISWEFMLQSYYFTKNEEALKAVNTTLTEMAKGGIYDQVGGGFARYSVDEFWKVPHFEKMLYDNGQMVSLYAHAYQITKNPYYEQIVRNTLTFVQRELSSKEGGFYSSLDADSEGIEGKFYVWSAEEISNTLSETELEIVKEFYGITTSGNWENGTNILHSKLDPYEYQEKKEIRNNGFVQMLEGANQKLLNARSLRERPGTDDKILTSWNALMIKGFLDAYRTFGDQQFLDSALDCARFLEKNMIRHDHSIYRNYKNDTPSVDGFLDDYALLSQAFIELYQLSFDIHWLELGRDLADYVLAHFSDHETGLFFYTSDISEKLFARKHEVTDNVIPSSNSVFAHVLFKLGILYDDKRFTERALRMLNQVADQVKSGSPYYSNWAILLGMFAYGVHEIAILGNQAAKINLDMQRQFLPNAVFMGGNEENLDLLKGKLVQDSTLIFVCKNKVCQLPVKDPIAALKQIIFLNN